MTLLALLAATHDSPTPPPPASEVTPMPVTVPGVPAKAPWHMDAPLNIATYDGSNQVVHPSVVDFGGKWNGYRFWMVYTPYADTGPGGTDASIENPTIAASNDCLTWAPIGPQPLVPHPTGGTTSNYNSDVELHWNPESARLELWWRSNYPGERLEHMHSPDGVTWSTKTRQTIPSATQIGWQAPCVVRVAADQWLMFDRYDAGAGGHLRRSTATSPEGPWSAPVECGQTAGSPDPRARNLWHAGITRAEDGTLYALAHMYAPQTSIDAAKSTDNGLTWTWTTGVMNSQAGTWTERSLYRPCLVPHENGTHMRVWYTGQKSVRSGGLGYRLGYTELPLTVWQ